MTDKPQIDTWHRKEHPEALMPLREAWTALPERDRGDLVERWRRARSLSEEASGTQLDAWGVLLDLPRGRAMDKRTDQLVSEPDEAYRAVLLERLGPGELQAREPGPVMPPSDTEYATRVSGKWLLAEVDASVMHGSSPEHLARQIRQVPGVVDVFLDGLRVGKREPAQGGVKLHFDQVPSTVIDARLDLLRHSAGAVNTTLRRDSNGCLRLSARIPAPGALPHALLDRFATFEEVKRAAGPLGGEALDLWGCHLEMKRVPGEADALYRSRLLCEARTRLCESSR